MKSKGKLFKRFSRKVSIFSTVMLILQPLLMVAVTPVASAASYEAPAATQKEGLDTTTGSFGSLKTNNNIGMHVNSGETLYIDTFDTEGIDENDIQNVVLKIKYRTEEDYIGTDVIKYALEGDEASSTTIVPSLNEEYSIESYNLLSQGVDTKEKIENLDVAFSNNSDSGDEADEDVVIDYLWVEVETNEIPQVTLTSKPELLTNLSSANFEWEGQDDTTDPSSLEYSYRLDGGEWTDYFSDEDNTADFVGLSEGQHNFELRTKDEDLNLTLIGYEWTIDLTPPTFVSTVTPTSANKDTKTVNIEIIPSEELKQKSIGVLVQQDGVEVHVLGPIYEVVITIENDGVLAKYYLSKDIDGKYKLPYEIKTIGEKTITFDIEGTDLAGNEGVGEGSFILDNIAPGKVIDLKAIAGNGKVDLSWTNPADGDLANIQIVRNGTLLATLIKSSPVPNTYSDTTAVNGTAYTYDFYAIDTAGNRSEKVSVNVTPVAPVVTAVAASEVTSAITTETIKPADEGEIKAEVKEAEEEEPKKDTEVKEDKKIPVWGILFLLILAAIGGYLFYVQNPERFSSLNGKR